ncbi:hypothetical protein [Streptomyces sp. NPDC018711]|uniref:hypothetical protein n=1 Tax=Streptomyces sp. NPDC018711 TaxID=3365052 RepID=UPI0037B9D04E
MAVERSEAEKSLMDQYALPWVEADEDDAYAGSDSLRPFGSKFAEDRADAAKAVDPLVSGGRGEAAKALAEHWAGVETQFKNVSEAATAIVDGMHECGKIVADTKNAVLDRVDNLRSSISHLSYGNLPRRIPYEDLVADEAEKARPGIQAEVDSATTRSDEHLKRVRNNEHVGSLKSIAGRPQGTGGSAGTGKRAGDSMHLASAGGSPWGDLFHDYDEHKRAVKKLGEIATHIRDTTSQPLAQAVLDTTELGASGAVGASLAAGIHPLLDDLVLASRALADHLTGPLSDAIKAAAKDQKEREDDIKGGFGWMR